MLGATRGVLHMELMQPSRESLRTLKSCSHGVRLIPPVSWPKSTLSDSGRIIDGQMYFAYVEVDYPKNRSSIHKLNILSLRQLSTVFAVVYVRLIKAFQHQ